MFCSNCGTQIPDGAMFCPGCGSSTGAPVQPVQPTPVPQPAPQPVPVQQVAQSAPAPQPVPVQQVAQSAPAPQPVQQVVQPTPAPQPAPVKSKKKKGKTGLIIAIISLLVIAGGVLAFLFLYLFPKKNVELLCKNAWYMVEGIDYNDSDYTGKMMGQYGLEFKEKGTAILHEVYDEETEYDWEISGNTLKCDYFNDDVEILNITDEEFVVKSGDDEIIFVTKKILKKEYKDLYDKYMTIKAKAEAWYATSDTPPAVDNGALPPAADDSFGKDKNKLIKIGIINSDPNESGYRVAQDKDFKTFFTKDNGFDACFAYSMKNDEQIAAAQKLVQDRVDYLLICPANSDGWDNVLKEAQNAGTKVIIYDREVNVDSSLYYTSIVPNLRKEGEDAVEWLYKQNLDHYSIIHIQGISGSEVQRGRSAALEEAVANNNNWEYLIQDSANWSAEEARNMVYDVIEVGRNVPNVIYAESDEMARGAAQALDELGYAHGTSGDIIIIGFDCNRWALEELLNGRWNYDGQCSPFYASTVADVIESIENGRPVDKRIYIKDIHFTSDTITEDDVKKYGI